MLVTRIRLRNYRVYEEPLDLEVPGGLVGIYGPNGSGKSYLLESIRWTLYGRSRTGNEEVRTAGVLADCVTEVELEHEGHLYLVRRTLSGVNATIRAEARADGRQVASGGRDVVQYVQSVLGMDDTAFRASVFAEQKQLAAFSGQTAAKRRELVLRLLGITPLDRARDAARRDARVARDDHERLRGVLPDLEELRLTAAELNGRSQAAETATSSMAERRRVARRQRAEAEARFERLDGLRRTHDDLMAEGRTARAEHDAARRDVERLEGDLAELGIAATRLAELRPEADGLDEVEGRLVVVSRVVAAAEALRAVAVQEPPAPPGEEDLEAARRGAAGAAARLAAADGLVQASEAELARARQAGDRSEQLSDVGDCPLCGQPLGTAFERVQAHRRAEVAECVARLGGATADRDAARQDDDRAKAQETAQTGAFEAARREWAVHEQALARRQALREDLERAQGAMGLPLVEGEAADLRSEVGRRRRAATECTRLGGVLERRPATEQRLEEARVRAADAAGRREALLDKVRALAFRPADLEEARAVLASARQADAEATTQAEDARNNATRVGEQARAAAQRLADGEAQHARLADLADGALHLGRLAGLLNTFRTSVVATVGPRLAAQAADLFAELTDHEYDRLEVDPETYEIQIRDAGRLYGMDRFSGSETDLANLALRVAISEHIRFQSGGAVGLLALDEVFGPLDDERRERMLLALERLRGRFRQVLVVTHASEVKEQLPGAIEVVKLAGRRATARVVSGA